VNAAIWFGASIFSGGGADAIFSPEMIKLFTEAGVPPLPINFIPERWPTRYFTVISRCSMFADYRDFPSGRGETGISAVRFRGSESVWLECCYLWLWRGLGLQPRMEKLRAEKYSNVSAEQKAKADHSFNTLHAVSECINLFVMAGLLIHYSE